MNYRGHMVLAFGLAAASSVAAQPQPRFSTAIVNVNVIAIDDARVDAGRTVVVRGAQVTAVGPAATTPVPADALVIDGGGLYLVPGLVDAHVHITTDMPWAPARPDFGDAPLYLAHGVTTVINLHGGPLQLDWRRRVIAGELPGPTIYTSGPFINEPAFRTPDEVRAEVIRQAREGYDVVKFHELADTSLGLSEPAYIAMVETAREYRMPLVGHAPVNLGFDVLLRSRQSLAHTGALSTIAFRPVQRHLALVLASIASLAGLIVLAAVNWLRKRRRPDTRVTERQGALPRWALAAIVLSAGFVFVTLPGAPFFQNAAMRGAATTLAMVVAAFAARAMVITLTGWQRPSLTWADRIHAVLVTVLLVTFAYALLTFWVPVVRRGSPDGIASIARDVAEAQIPVQSTLVVYESMASPERAKLIDDPVITYLHPAARIQWRALPREGPPGFRFHTFMKQVIGALDAAGAPVMAGTDAMGMPLITPGASLLRELELLTESGLTSYETLRAATTTPARFLHREAEFGRIAAGLRADLLLVRQNPIEDIRHLRTPVGVMVRGEWFARDRLDQLLASLARD